MNTKQTTTTFTIPDALMDMGVSLVSALARIATAMEQRNIDELDYTAILQRDSDRADGDLVMRYMRDVRWLNECNEQIESKTFPLLSEREQERLQSQFDIAQRDLNEFNRAYPWIAEKAT